MSNLDTQIRSAVTERAAEWFATHRAGELAERESAAFFAWLKTSPMHVEEYLALAALEGELTEALTVAPLSLQQLRELAQQESDKVTQLGAVRWWREPTVESRHVLRGRPPWVLGAVVTAVLGLGAAALWVAPPSLWQAGAQSYQTARGAQTTQSLTDGSTLNLDTDSAVTVRFSAGERRVSLDRGQALFQVAHDTARPFRVIVGGTTVVAVGTEFDVYRRAGSVLVTVLQGRVKVSTPLQPTDAAGQNERFVSAGEQLEVVADAAPGAPVHVDAARAVTWLQHQIVFEQRPLGELADEFNRYNRVAVIIEDPALRSLPVSGVFNVYDLDSFTAFLASLDRVKVDRSADSIRVSQVRRPQGAAVP